VSIEEEVFRQHAEALRMYLQESIESGDVKQIDAALDAANGWYMHYFASSAHEWSLIRAIRDKARERRTSLSEPVDSKLLPKKKRHRSETQLKVSRCPVCQGVLPRLCKDCTALLAEAS
jgi:hypothetical protein